MWTRKELKEKGKTSFKANYWKAVLVGLIFTVIAGGASGVSVPSGNSFSSLPGHKLVGSSDDVSDDIEEMKEDIEEMKEDIAESKQDAAEDIEEASEEIEDAVENPDEDSIIINLPEDMEKGLKDSVAKTVEAGAMAGFVVVMIIVAIVVTLVVMAIAFAFSAFLLNPIEMGCDRFFYRNLKEPVEVARNVFYAFDNNYKNVVKTLFLRDLYSFLWSLLFIIPGIVKSYEYRMIPYLLAEDPGMSTEEAFRKSKEMMSGQKWRAFVLDLSFIGWDLLSILTCGILSIFYVTPYQRATNAALYEALKPQDPADQMPMIEEIAEA